MPPKSVETVRDGDLVLMRLDRPESLNAIDAGMAEEMEAVIHGVKRDPEIRALIITGNGRAFSAGADTAQFGDLDEAQALAVAEVGESMIRELETVEAVTVAAVNGPAVGGGCNLALACDFRVAHRRARFGFPEVRFNLPLGWNGMRRLVAAVGLAKAKDLLLTCRLIDADEALGIGLVDSVTDADDVVATARTLAATVGGHGALAVSITKRYLHAIAYGDSMAGRFDRDLTALGLRSEHFRRAAAALKKPGKRPAQ
jgi:enoyl-CoA hydratase